MRRSGAREFKFDIDTGVGTLLPPQGKPVDFGAIVSGVKEGGFQLLWIEARVGGELRSVTGTQDAGKNLVVDVDSPRQRFVLVEGHTDAERRGYGRLRESAGREPVRVEVRGRVHTHTSGAPGLTVLDFHLKTLPKTRHGDDAR